MAESLLNDDWFDPAETLPEPNTSIFLKQKDSIHIIIGYLGYDEYWHDSIGGKKIPSHMITGWSRL